ncbi:MAG: hypothetical protein ACC682_06345 [Gemmatimonadota bacterium]
MNRTLLARVFVAAAATAFSGCVELNSVEVQELEGLWVADQARYVEIAAPKRNNVDILELGFEVTMDIDPNGNFTILVIDPAGDADSIVGNVTVDGAELAVVTEDGAGDGEVFLEEDQVAFRLTGGIEFDFGDDRVVPARLLLVLDRVRG